MITKKEHRQHEVDLLMAGLSENSRENWCEAVDCGCLGCVQLGTGWKVTKEEWLDWKQRRANKEWNSISIKLTGFFGICSCQRKLKTIIDNLYRIYQVCEDAYEKGTPRDFTGAEWLLIAMMDKGSNLISHGINCEYPIINKEHPFWVWILKVKDSPYLEDN